MIKGTPPDLFIRKRLLHMNCYYTYNKQFIHVVDV